MMIVLYSFFYSHVLKNNLIPIRNEEVRAMLVRNSSIGTPSVYHVILKRYLYLK